MSDRLKNIPEIVALLQAHGITDFAIADAREGYSLKLRWADHWVASSPPIGVTVAPSQSVKVSSPCVGTFIAKHPMRVSDISTPGSVVAQGDILALIKVRRTFRAVVAPCDGILSERLCEPGTDVEYGTSLFTIQQRA